MAVVVRRCERAQLPAIERGARATGKGEAWIHHVRERLALQEKRGATLLLAWDGELPCGNATVYRASKYAVVRTAHPGLPEINALEAFPTGRGTGSALIAACEENALTSGQGRIGLAVESGNARALRLYEHLGFRPAGIDVVDEWQEYRPEGDGPRHADPCRYYVKDLAR